MIGYNLLEGVAGLLHLRGHFLLHWLAKYSIRLADAKAYLKTFMAQSSHRLPAQPPKSRPTCQSRVLGCWLGKSIGGTLGLPPEGRMERMHFTFYDPVPTSAPPNDDLELQLVWLHLLETRGLDLSQAEFARAWLDHIHYMWDEYGRCRWNLRRNVPVTDLGTFENSFTDGMGSPIRSEIWACLGAGNVNLAARYAALDASLDHGPEGIVGEVFLAVLQTLVFDGVELHDALTKALASIDGRTETARAISLTSNLHTEGMEAWICRERLLTAHANENFTHAPINVALTVWALLYGEDDFEKSILLAVNAGYDTDCTAATVGATLGLAHGQKTIPERWRKPIGNNVLVGAGILGISCPATLEELTQRTIRLMEQLKKAPTEPSLALPSPTGQVSLQSLPGTIRMLPRGSSSPIPWANGELPPEVKIAGGASWTWDAGEGLGQPHFLVCLARNGAQLWVDDKRLIHCPAGLPYVPATHRCPQQARVSFIPDKPRHQLRLELESHAASQQASVLLASNNFHLASWSADTLPHAAKLPPPQP